MPSLLSVTNLWKQYPKEKEPALRGVSFDIREGEIFGLLGPNGAGKSTAINIVAGLLSPDEGSITTFGKNYFLHREYCQSRMNISSAYANLPYPLTIEQNLQVFSMLYGIPHRQKKIEEVLEIFQITHLRKKKISKLSSGQIARVNLCKAFLNDPKLLLLDEPTSSLDPELAIEMRRRIKKLQKERGLTILWTSHNMPEVEEVCDRIAFLLNGKIHVIDTPKNLLKLVKTQEVSVMFQDVKEIKKLRSKKLPTGMSIKRNEGKNMIFQIPYSTQALKDFLSFLEKNQVQYVDLHLDPPSLEEVFLELAKQQKPPV